MCQGSCERSVLNMKRGSTWSESDSEDESSTYPVFSPKQKRFRTPDEAGPSSAGPSGVCTAAFSDDEEEKEEKLDREELLKQIDQDINRLIEEGKRIDKKEEILKKAKAVKLKGRDGAEYTLEIFMRSLASCRSRKDRAGNMGQLDQQSHHTLSACLFYS